MAANEAAASHEPVEAHTRRLGRLLVDADLITEEDLADALAEQAETGRLLGEILIARRLVSSPVLAQALAAQNGTELVVEQGFGAGLWARIERRHPARRISIGHRDELERETGEPHRPPAAETPSTLLGDLRPAPTDVLVRLEQLEARVAALEAAAKPKPARASAKRTAKSSAKAKPGTPVPKTVKSPASRKRRPASTG